MLLKYEYLIENTHIIMEIFLNQIIF